MAVISLLNNYPKKKKEILQNIILMGIIFIMHLLFFTQTFCFIKQLVSSYI